MPKSKRPLHKHYLLSAAAGMCDKKALLDAFVCSETWTQVDAGIVRQKRGEDTIEANPLGSASTASCIVSGSN